MKLLLTNDDGVDAEGLNSLRAAARGLGEPAVVAPAGPQSGVRPRAKRPLLPGSAHLPSRLFQLEPIFFVQAVYFAIVTGRVLPEQRPDEDAGCEKRARQGGMTRVPVVKHWFQ